MDHLLGMWHYPRSYGLVDIKREVKVEGMVTGLKQLIRDMRLSLMKPQHLLLFHSQWQMGLYTCGLQSCSDVIWAFRGGGVSRVGYIRQRLSRGQA